MVVAHSGLLEGFEASGDGPPGFGDPGCDGCGESIDLPLEPIELFDDCGGVDGDGHEGLAEVEVHGSFMRRSSATRG